MELRAGGIRQPILVMTGFWPGEEKNLLKHRLTTAVTRCEQLKLLERAAARARRKVRFHLKVQTGMNRLGISPSDVPCFVRTLADSPHLELEGNFTHFASSEVFTNEDTEAQRIVFEGVLERLRAERVTAPLIHLANSAAIVLRPGTWGTMVRPGLILYGYHQYFEPEAMSGQANVTLPLRPALALRARLISLRDVAPGQGVGYNHRWIASRPSRIAVISAGYADGIPRKGPDQQGARDHPRQVRSACVGTVSMDLITVDVTDLPEARFGDVATLYGADGETTQYVSLEVARQVGTFRCVRPMLCVGQACAAFLSPHSWPQGFCLRICLCEWPLTNSKRFLTWRAYNHARGSGSAAPALVPGHQASYGEASRTGTFPGTHLYRSAAMSARTLISIPQIHKSEVWPCCALIRLPGRRTKFTCVISRIVKSPSAASSLEGAHFGTWWDRMVVRVIFSGACLAAGYHFHPFGLSPLIAALVGISFSFAVFLFEMRLERASLRRLIGAAVGSILGILGAYLMGLVLARTSIPEGSRSFLDVGLLLVMTYIMGW